MITVMDSLKELPMRNSDKCLDSQLWHACTGGMVQMPPINSKIFYFPQGHIEHAVDGDLDTGNSRIPSFLLCRVSAIRYMANPETDEVYSKIKLIPLRENEWDFDGDGFVGNSGIEGQEKPVSFAKTLTQSDANNGGGFSVPRYCAETIFPHLDYNAKPPVQTILAKDVHMKLLLCFLSGLSFSMLPRAVGQVFHCHRDVECFFYLKNCKYIRICGQQGICVCTGKKEAILKVNESSPK